MCNLAGYVGSKRAAPVLIDMLKEQEGFAGGYYTGIATMDDEKLYWAKVIGDVSELVKNTDAFDLPGTTGIIHSRSKSGGDKNWAHPFVNKDETMAYLANGHEGYFGRYVNSSEIAQKLEKEGYVYRSKTTEKIIGYPSLSDGGCVHLSEVMCHLIDANTYDDPSSGMKKSFAELPGEIVALMLNIINPKAIYASRISQPLMIGYSNSAAYVSTSALVFPEDVHNISMMPICSTAEIGIDSFKVLPFDITPAKVCNKIPWHKGYTEILKLLSADNEEGFGIGDLKKVTAPLWPEHMVPQKDMMVYEILRFMYEEGKIQFKYIKRQGAVLGLTTMQKVVCLKK